MEESQHPIAAVLGCADSRVPVELLFDTGFGDLFVVGQLRMELFALGAADNLAQACRDHCRNAARNLVDSSVLLTDRVRDGRLRVESAFYNLHSTAIDWLGPVSPQPSGTWEDGSTTGVADELGATQGIPETDAAG